MNQDDMLRIAEEAGLQTFGDMVFMPAGAAQDMLPVLQRFTALIEYAIDRQARDAVNAMYSQGFQLGRRTGREESAALVEYMQGHDALTIAAAIRSRNEFQS